MDLKLKRIFSNIDFRIEMDSIRIRLNFEGLKKINCFLLLSLFHDSRSHGKVLSSSITQTFWESLLIFSYIVAKHCILCLQLELTKTLYQLLPLKEDRLDDRPFLRGRAIVQLITWFL